MENDNPEEIVVSLIFLAAILLLFLNLAS